MSSGLLLLVVLAGSPESSGEPDWMSVRGGVLTLALAHEESQGPDGGTLTVDPNRRVVLWEGIPGELGCKDKREVRFEDIRTVRTQEGSGFVIEFNKRVGKRLVLLPRSHAPWFQGQWKNPDAALSPVLGGLRTADGEGGMGMGIGGVRGGVGPPPRRRELPKEVRADTRAAVAAVLEALDRRPAPGAVLLETLYGDPAEISLKDLLDAPTEHEGRAVRVTALLRSISGDGREHVFADDALTLRVTPAPEVAQLLSERGRAWHGEQIEVTGVFYRHVNPDGGPPTPAIRAWEYTKADETRARDAFRARVTTLQALAGAAPVKGDLVRVVGRFRGRNLHRDLPEPLPRLDAWVIKHGTQAAWVIGKAPQGKAWRLDPGSLADTKQWVEIVAQPEIHDGVLRLKALRVAPAAPPSKSWVRSGPRVLTSSTPPILVFTLPVDGEMQIPRDSRFVLQFSRYMDEETFEGRVQLRYAGPREGDPAFDRMRLSYDETKRALIVDPGLALEPGRDVECVLLPGITSADGQPLVGRPGKGTEGVIDVLRYHVGS